MIKVDRFLKKQRFFRALIFKKRFFVADLQQLFSFLHFTKTKQTRHVTCLFTMAAFPFSVPNPLVHALRYNISVDGVKQVLDSPFPSETMFQPCAKRFFEEMTEEGENVGFDGESESADDFIDSLWNLPLVMQQFNRLDASKTASQNDAASLRQQMKPNWHRAASAMTANASPLPFAQDTPNSSATSSPHRAPTMMLRLKVKRISGSGSPERNPMVVDDSDDEGEEEERDNPCAKVDDVGDMEYTDIGQLKQAIKLTRARLNFLCEALSEALEAQGQRTPPKKKAKVAEVKKVKKH